MALGSDTAVRVEGLRDLQRAFAKADNTMQREFRSRLKDAAEPVRDEAEQLATANISRIGLTWSRMRVGVTRTAVYVAPRERGRRGGTRRPNLAFLLGHEMETALENNVNGVRASVEDLLDEMGRDWERA